MGEVRIGSLLLVRRSRVAPLTVSTNDIARIDTLDREISGILRVARSAPPHPSSSKVTSLVVVDQLRMVIRLYSGVTMILFSLDFVRWADRRWK